MLWCWCVVCSGELTSETSTRCASLSSSCSSAGARDDVAVPTEVGGLNGEQPTHGLASSRTGQLVKVLDGKFLLNSRSKYDSFKK